jgi:hypothetical protein
MIIMEPTIFEELKQCLADRGAGGAIGRLCEVLRERKDYPALFYALLLKKRHELGVTPIPTSPTQDLPTAVHEPYEVAIREAARLVGGLFLADGNIPHAWAYFRMIGEPEPVAQALEKVQPGENDDVQQLVEIAYHNGVNPRKGFDWILERFGICNAITTVTGQDLSMPVEVREYCLKRLVRSLYAELYERLKAEVVRTKGAEPAATSVRGLMVENPGLFEDEFYHIDVSHLSAVVQMSGYLPAGEEIALARELCEYGQRLSPRFQQQSEPPFEDMYRDHAVYLDVIAGQDIEKGLDHFRAKVVNADPEAAGTRPAEVLVNLLLRLKRPDEALEVARRHLANTDNRQLMCPSISELCEKANNFRALAEVAQEQADPVHYLAALLAEKQNQ